MRCHTPSSRSENRYWYNVVETGEIGQSAIVASYDGVPYQVKLPIQAKKQWYTLDANQVKDMLMTREGEILDLRDLDKF